MKRILQNLDHMTAVVILSQYLVNIERYPVMGLIPNPVANLINLLRLYEWLLAVDKPTRATQRRSSGQCYHLLL